MLPRYRIGFELGYWGIVSSSPVLLRVSWSQENGKVLWKLWRKNLVKLVPDQMKLKSALSWVREITGESEISPAWPELPCWGQLTCNCFLEHKVSECTTVCFFFSPPLLIKPWTISGQFWVLGVLFSSSASEQVGLVSPVCSLRIPCPLIHRSLLPNCPPAPTLPQPGHQCPVTAQVSLLFGANPNLVVIKCSQNQCLLGCQSLRLGLTVLHLSDHLKTLDRGEALTSINEFREVHLENHSSAVDWSLYGSCSFKAMIACPRRHKWQSQ